MIKEEVNPSMEKTLEYKLKQRNELWEKTNHYWGVKELSLKEQDPIKYERFFSRLQSSVFAAREKARYVAASPGGREMGESLWALTTAEGDTLALSLGFISHAAAFNVSIKHMIDNNFELNPGINDGDVFSADDPMTSGAPHPGDTYTLVPIAVDGEVVAWACSVNHIMEAGAPQAGSWPVFTVDTFMDGFVFPPMKTGEKLRQAKWWENLWKRRTRAGQMNILDDKMRLAGCSMIHSSIHEIVEEYGIDYFKQACKEILEESRRMILDKMRATMVPGRYENACFRISMLKGQQSIWEHADKNELIHVRGVLSVNEKGGLVWDTEGSSRWGYHGFNGYPGGADVGLHLQMTTTFAHDVKATGGVQMNVESIYHKGSIYNPDTEFAACANIWAQSMQMQCAAGNSVHRSFFMRGYLEEAFTVDDAWEGVQGHGVLEDGTPYGFTNFEWVGGTAMGAYSFKDGMPTAWCSHTQLCNVGNSEEFEYLIPPLHHLGRKLQPGYCGHGKYRGGIGQTAVHWMKATGQRLGVSRGGVATSLSTYGALGMNGAYPAPGVVTVIAKNTNLQEIFSTGGDTPTTAGELLQYAEEGKIKGEIKTWKYDPPEQAMIDDDLWANAAGASGGWGDPMERDVAAVIEDINTGQLPEGFARTMYGVIANEESNELVSLNEEETESQRRRLLDRRRRESVPVSEWLKAERKKLVEKEIREELLEMYCSSTSFPGYNRHFREFWQLDDDFEI
jgi:N-methylhydantoinase B/acetone carboxylase alpha subunit